MSVDDNIWLKFNQKCDLAYTEQLARERKNEENERKDSMLNETVVSTPDKPKVKSLGQMIRECKDPFGLRLWGVTILTMEEEDWYITEKSIQHINKYERIVGSIYLRCDVPGDGSMVPNVYVYDKDKSLLMSSPYKHCVNIILHNGVSA